ncbi:hypothetical protein MNBD_ALPHA12-2074 [hydrothermal vent metagenome]|uniref:Uncharacterized protein n=1 Tax=hydrothermal vent metagenome TaxID=652676 RepID=A0A3B0TWI8_9ZZZZ
MANNNSIKKEKDDDDIALLTSAAVAAGIMAMGFFRREVKTWTKENSSPVTEADYLVDQFLGQTLLAARPQYGWLSEESPDNKARLDKKRIFVVDPIDGTRGFIRGEDSWTICLGVVENGKAISGVIYAPARDELYQAALGKGAKLNGAPLVRHPHSTNLPIIPAAGAVEKELAAAGLDFVRGPSLPSLAYRLVQVATGALDGALARRGARDWDISAAAIILAECGIALEDVCAGVPVFNRKNTRHGALAALADPSLKPLVHNALVNVYGCPKP